MLVVVSSPVSIPREAAHINHLFEAGLEVLHLRKPEANEEVLNTLLRDIDPKYYDRLAWHQHHSVGERWAMHRRHLTATVRQQTPGAKLDHWKAAGQLISTSIHTPEEYKTLPATIDYALLGPVFPSISKPGYQTATPLRAPARSPHGTKVVAIGGIEAHRCEEIFAQAFDGIAVLGSIWQQGDPTENFKLLQEAWYIHGR
jgi:thiamine-phosphate pyrophosphorylase